MAFTHFTFLFLVRSADGCPCSRSNPSTACGIDALTLITNDSKHPKGRKPGLEETGNLNKMGWKDDQRDQVESW